MTTLMKSVLWVILAAILIVGMLYVAKYGPPDFTRFTKSNYSYNDDEYTPGEGKISGELKALDISWTAGSVEVVLYDGTEVTLEESAPYELANEELLRWKLKNGTLTVKFRAPGWGRALTKDLVVYLPEHMGENLDQFLVNTVSAGVKTTGVKSAETGFSTVSGDVSYYGETEKLNADTVSGNITADILGNVEDADIGTVSGSVLLEGNGVLETVDIDSVSGGITIKCEAANVEINSTSGSVFFEGASEKLYFSTTSGGIDLRLSGKPKDIKANSTSGSMRLTWPEEIGFTLEMDSVSGGFTSDLPVRWADKKAVFGDGACQIEFDSVSGDMNIS